MDAQQPKKRQKAIIALSVLLVFMVCIIVLLFVKYRREANSNPVNQQEQLTEQVSRIIEMPAEEPIVSTVLDSSKLTSPTLASRARNGDILFIFPQSKRLVLYRPANQKVVDMLNIQNN